MKIKNKVDMARAISQLNEWQFFYDIGKPVVSDKEYDDLYFQLQEAEKEMEVVLENSPTHHIVYEVKDELKEVVHNHPMLSLSKTKNWDEFLNYFDMGKDVIGMVKLDGLTCSLHYLNGELVGAETRGNGEKGSDILNNVKTMASVPQYIDYKDELIIDGEVISTYKNFERFADQFANPRNFASGSLKLLDANEFSKRGLIFIAWNVVKGLDNNSFFNNLSFLDGLGFSVVPWTSSFDWDAKDFLQEQAKKLGYPIDGLVGRYDDIQYGESLGATGHHSRAAFAFKFYDEEYDTELLNIEWQIGRTGIVTPVAVFEPVDTGDSTIERASLHNISVMYNILGRYPEFRQPIKVAKMNEIIPQIVSAEYKNDELNEKVLNIDYKCPVCGETLEFKNNDGILTAWCCNKGCPGKLINILDHYCSKEGLNIKGISEQTLEKLLDWGWVNSIEDLYKLDSHREEWICKEGWGIASVDKILLNIKEASKSAETWRIISSIGIPLIGVVNAKELAKHFDLDTFICNAKEGYDFSQLNGFGPEMNNAIQNFDYSELESLLDNGYLIAKTSENIATKGICDGLVFVITGAVTHYANRDELKSAIEANGGKVSGSVSKNTSYLINNDITSSSSKNVKAKQLNIPIITEDEFIEKFLK